MPMPFVSVVNLGCRVNRVESDRMTLDFARAGFGLVDEDEADLVVINTCAVTGEAEAKTRKAVRHAVNLPRKPYVVVTGCAVNLHPDSLAELSDRVVIEPMKTDVAARAADLLGFGETGACDGGLDSRELADLLGRSRLGVKIQDGCNNRCTYCIVWKARGPERSVSVPAVLDQVRLAERAGVPEVVLTGVNLGAYDGIGAGDAHVEIDELVETILHKTAIPQLRLSSLEPMDVADRLLDVMAAHPDRIAPFLHLPLQSGCSATLARMGRPYTAEEFHDLCLRVRRRIPAIALSCDVIVGFPGETDAEFSESLAFCRKVGFARMHVFRYSPRPGTAAAAMDDQVPPELKEARGRAMRELARELALADARSRVGTVEFGVVEDARQVTLGSYHRLRLRGGADALPATRVPVAIEAVEDSGELWGTVAASEDAEASEVARG